MQIYLKNVDLSSPRYVQIVILLYTSVVHGVQKIEMQMYLIPLIESHVKHNYLFSFVKAYMHDVIEEWSYVLFFWHLIISSGIMIVREMAKKIAVLRGKQKRFN